MNFLLNIINGLYSGIPICCILFFTIRSLKPNYRVALETDKERGFEIVEEGEGYRSSTKMTEYVQCNKCFSKNQVVKIKKNGGWSYATKPFRIVKW